MSTRSTSNVAHPFGTVNTPPLPPKVLAALQAKYTRAEGRRAREKLHQGEIDVLESCREALGWPSITSLAAKYYPLYPHRKAWRHALLKCRHCKCKTATLNIKYLLHVVITKWEEILAACYPPREALNRLAHLPLSIYRELTGREQSISTEVARKGPGDRQEKYYRGKFAGLVRR